MKITNSLILLLAIAAVGFSARAGNSGNNNAQQAAEATADEAAAIETAFAPGEKLVYVGSYGAALVPELDAGEAVLKVTRTTVAGTPAYNVHGSVKAYSNFKLIFDINDTYQTWLDAETLKPLKYSERKREGKYKFNADYAYDWQNMVVNTSWQNMKRPTGKTKTMAITDRSFDAIALFYNLRNEDIASFKVGEQRTLELVLEDTVRRINYKYMGKEERRVRRLGTFKTLKFSCTIATSNGETFKDGTELFLWVTDDKNKVPVYAQSPVKIGSVRATLLSHSGLKYPLDSKVK